MAVLCGMPTIQYSARSVRLSVHKLFTSCIRRGLVSSDSVVDGDWLRVMSALSAVLSTRVGPRTKFGEVSYIYIYIYIYGVYRPGEWLWIDPNKGYFGSEFMAICNHCTVMSASIRKTCCVQILWNLAYGKSMKSCVVCLAKKIRLAFLTH